MPASPRPGACSLPAWRKYCWWASTPRGRLRAQISRAPARLPTRKFLAALGPAIIGAGGVQLALFADTLIASYLPTGALSALYYADRINQLPIGVVGIAVGTVLLPEMSRRLAAGDGRGAALAQARGIQLALLLTVPCVAAAIAIPDLIMRALFARGAFTTADAAAAGATLAAYAIGLLPFVMLRSFTAPFYARGDTLTPVKAALLAASVNIALKVMLMGTLPKSASRSPPASAPGSI